MNCRGCGTELEPTAEEVNAVVDEVLQTSVEDATRKGGVCPLCGHSKAVPASHRKSVQFALLATCAILLTLTIALIAYYRSPLRSSVGREALARARDSAAVRTALGEPIRAGRAVKGTVHRDETGWSEAKFDISLSGPKGKALLRVTAATGTGKWVFSDLEVIVEGQPQPIDLLQVGTAESVQPGIFPQVHAEAATLAELRNDYVEPRVPLAPGSYPCVMFQPPSDSRPMGILTARITECPITMSADANISRYEVDLRTGQFVVRNTDLFRADLMPLAFTRTYRSGWSQATSLGYATSHPYDVHPVGSRNPYTFIDVMLPDNTPVHFERISKGTGYPDAVYQHAATDTIFFRSVFRWDGNGWTLRFADGSYYRFPESYHATNAAQGGLIEMHDTKGNQVQIARDEARKLLGLISPRGRWIRFKHNSKNLISEATDDTGRRVTYEYDHKGRLVEVSGPGATLTQFSYDGAVMTGVGQNGRQVLQNTYEDGRLVRQMLSDGSTYIYRYVLQGDAIVQTTVRMPNGTEKTLAVKLATQ